MTSLIGKLLASKLLAAIGKAILISLLEQLAQKSDNKIDDKIVADVKKALE